MFSRMILLSAAAVLLALSSGCSNHPASDSVKAFSMALADSSWSRAWDLLTPSTRAAWDSTATVMRRFGYTESSRYLSTLETPVTQAEFDSLTGEMLFLRMMESNPGVRELSGSVRGVELRDSLTALVTVATVDGSQIIPVRLIQDRWLIDLTTLSPPAVPEEEQ